MPPREPIRTYVPQAQQKKPSTERGDWVERHKLPVLIRLFVWLLVFRAAANLIFALIVGLAPDYSRLQFRGDQF